MNEMFQKILIGLIRYISTSVLTMLIILTLATGKFPPPILETWENLKTLQKELGSAKNLQQLARSRQEQKQILSSLEHLDEPYKKSPSLPKTQTSEPVQHIDVDLSLDDKVKALEWQNKALTERLIKCQQSLGKTSEQNL